MNPSENIPKHPGAYGDFYVRLVAALLAAHFIVAFGEQESLFQLLIMADYYRSLAGSFLIAFILVNIVYLVTLRLDRSCDWKQKPLQRSAWQLLLGLLFPCLLAFLLATVYFKLYGLNIFETAYLQYDFPVIVLMLLLLNAYYIAYYFYRRLRIIEKTVIEYTPSEGASLDIHSPTPAKEVFVIQLGEKNIPLSVTDIGYFYHEGDYNYLCTFAGHSHLVPQTLDELENQLDPIKFFRVNRQMIIHFPACKHFEPLPYGKLQLSISPAFKEPVIVSQKKAKRFKEWISR